MFFFSGSSAAPNGRGAEHPSNLHHPLKQPNKPISIVDKKLQILREKNRCSVQSWLPNVVFYLQLCVLELLFDSGSWAAEAVMQI